MRISRVIGFKEDTILGWLRDAAEYAEQVEPEPDWQYLQVVKQRENGRVIGTETRVIYGDKQLTPVQLGEHTAYVERTDLTTRHMNGRLVRKTLGFPKKRAMLKAACIWDNVVYDLARYVKTLRVEVNDDHRRWLQRSSAMGSGYH